MKKGSMKVTTVGEPTGRATRARAAAYQSSVRMLTSEVPKEQDQTRVLRKNSKRSALEERNTNAPVTARVQNKRRTVLKDVTNIYCDNSYKNCLNAAKLPVYKKNGKQTKKVMVGNSKVVANVAVDDEDPDSQTIKCNETGRAEIQSAEVECSVNLDKNIHLQQSTEVAEKENGINITHKGKRAISQLQRFSKKEKAGLHGKVTITSKPEFTDIDSDEKDPQICSTYAPEIYSNLRAAELIRRPKPDFMETVQRDVTQSMRGILADWLVEVSEEYKLVPDTLYLTVYLIDLFLSQHYIERQKLQLLGITCLLLASKYEEICAPRVEEFCFITDGTYTKAEVLRMESQVVNYLGFQLAAPTAKTFLRRFLRAAQASNKTPSLELEFLANYLAELTLIDYYFLKFIPSNVAASALFLARWTLDQSSHPWNPTLEHYTNYKPLDLKPAVLALHGLQSNANSCPLNAIRSKYKQDKFKSVATLPSAELLETLF